MPTLVVETEINASPETCFDLVRDISLHLQTAEKTNKKLAFEKTHGEIILGEIVTFESKHFGLTQKLKVEVIELEKPFRLTDKMIEGNFKSFKHIHEFVPENNQTLMRDTLIWTSPLGILGRTFDTLLLKNHLRNLVMRRNAELRRVAEGNL